MSGPPCMASTTPALGATASPSGSPYTFVVVADGLALGDAIAAPDGRLKEPAALCGHPVEVREVRERTVVRHRTFEVPDVPQDVAQPLGAIQYRLAREGGSLAATFDDVARNAVLRSRHHRGAREDVHRCRQRAVVAVCPGDALGLPAGLAFGVRVQRPHGVFGDSGVEVDEVVGVFPERLVDGVGDLLRQRAGGVAGEAAVEVPSAIALEWAHALVVPERVEIQDRQRHDGARHRARLQRAKELVDDVGAAVLVAVHAAVQPQRRSVAGATDDDDRDIHGRAIGSIHRSERAARRAGAVRDGRAYLDFVHAVAPWFEDS